MTYYSTEREPADELLSAPFDELDQSTYPVHESIRNIEFRLFEATLREAEEAGVGPFEAASTL
jgi:hypothetical protein